MQKKSDNNYSQRIKLGLNNHKCNQHWNLHRYSSNKSISICKKLMLLASAQIEKIFIEFGLKSSVRILIYWTDP